MRYGHCPGAVAFALQCGPVACAKWKERSDVNLGISQRRAAQLDRHTFETQSELNALFFDSRIRPFRNRVYDCSSYMERVNMLVDRLHDQHNVEGENAPAPGRCLPAAAGGAGVAGGAGEGGAVMGHHAVFDGAVSWAMEELKTQAWLSRPGEHRTTP